MTKLPNTQSVECELDQGWLTIWFNRPEKRNALSDGLLRDIKNILKTESTPAVTMSFFIYLVRERSRKHSGASYKSSVMACELRWREPSGPVS